MLLSVVCYCCALPLLFVGVCYCCLSLVLLKFGVAGVCCAGVRCCWLTQSLVIVVLVCMCCCLLVVVCCCLLMFDVECCG